MVICCVQVPLMAALPFAQVALDAHRGVAAVAEHGLGFFWNLSFADVNKVRGGRSAGCVVCFPCTWKCVVVYSVRPVCPVMVIGCVPGAADGGAALSPSSYGCPSRRGGRGRERAAVFEEPVMCGRQQGELAQCRQYGLCPVHLEMRRGVL